MASASNISINDMYMEWKERNPQPQMEEFQWIVHCTNKEAKEKITESGFLKPSHTPNKWKAPLANDDAPDGVWFSITQFMGGLPDMSPFGTERVQIDAKYMHEMPNLYLEYIHDGQINDTRLILTKDDNIKTWCETNGLLKLDITDNPFLMIKDGKSLTLTYGTDSSSRKTWVVVFIPYPVNVKGCQWDRVTLQQDNVYTVCYSCGEEGHWQKDCPEMRCHCCGKHGHWINDCPAMGCFRCGKRGHWQENCPETQCFRCQGYGHWASSCKNY